MNPYAGSIADLLANAKRQQAQRIVTAANISSAGQQRLADIAANALLQRSQNSTGLANSLAQIGSGSLGDYLTYRAYQDRQPSPTPPPPPGGASGGAGGGASFSPNRYDGRATFDRIYRMANPGQPGQPTVPY